MRIFPFTRTKFVFDVNVSPQWTTVFVYRKKWWRFYFLLEMHVLQEDDLTYSVIMWGERERELEKAYRNALCDRLGYLYNSVSVSINFKD